MLENLQATRMYNAQVVLSRAYRAYLKRRGVSQEKLLCVAPSTWPPRSPPALHYLPGYRSYAMLSVRSYVCPFHRMGACLGMLCGLLL